MGNPVSWHEGLFLRPHHFQAAGRHWSGLLRLSEQCDHQYSYGLRELSFSHEAIANNQFQLNACRARMRDGTLVSLVEGDAPDRVDLKEAFQRTAVVLVYLAVPKLKLGRPNVAGGADRSNERRFTEILQSIPDELAGGNEQEIQLLALNSRILLSTQDLSGYETLPIAQIRRAGEDEAVPRVDDDYFPPVLAVEAWTPLRQDILLAVYDIIGSRLEVLATHVIERGLSFGSQEPNAPERLLLLSELNQAYAALGVLVFATGVHPFVAYLELARIVGRLAIFGKRRRLPEIPKYDHDDLARIFKYLKQLIEELSDPFPREYYEQEYFVGEGRGMRVTLKSKWLSADWVWYVGVLRGELDEPQCRALLMPANLNWKLGSVRQVEEIFRQGQEGLRLKPLGKPPPVLPAGGQWLYFEVSRDNVFWDDVVADESLAMRLQENLIVNLGDLQGKRTLVAADRKGNRYALQFALFAVPVGAYVQ